MKLLLTLLLALAPALSANAQIISIDEDGNEHIYDPGELSGTYGGTFDKAALTEYQVYADKTGGTMAFCPKFEDLPKIVDLVLADILKATETNVDVAIVLDVTGSMGDEINEVKKNLARLMDNIQQQKGDKDIKVSLLVYRDLNQTDPFVTKVIQDFTADLVVLNTSVQDIIVGGGEDTREAILDALEAANSQLSFRTDASKNVVLIGDAPGHATSKTSGQTTDQVLDLLATTSHIKVYPMLVANVSGFGGDFGGGFGDFVTPKH